MKLSLEGRTLCIIGGYGFIGSNLAHQAATLGAKVFVVSSSATSSSESQWAERIKWVKGDSTNPESFKDVLEESEAVVHTLGVSIDRSITYEQKNLETAEAIGKTLSDLNKNQKLVYLSGAKHPPFLDRRFATKGDAEYYLRNLPGIRSTFLRPGFIYSDEVPLSKFLRYPIGIKTGVFRFIDRALGQESGLKNLFKNVDVKTPVDVRAVALSALISSFDSKFDGETLSSEDMEALKKRFLEGGYQFPS